MPSNPEIAVNRLATGPSHPDSASPSRHETVNGRRGAVLTKLHTLRRWVHGCAVVVACLGVSSVATAQSKEPGAPKKTLKVGAVAQKLAGDLVPAAEEAPEVKAGRGIVVIQRAGQPIGLGTVLSKDGRILTALSNLGAGNDLEAKFADDSVSKLKVGHHDRLWDLALLVPQSGKWTEGLVASPADPLREDAVIRSFSTAKGKPSAVPIDLRSKRSLIGGDDRLLTDALEIGSRIQGKDLGAPLIDEKGRVVGVLGRACLPIEGKPCAPVAYGVPVTAVKSFLKSVPEDAVSPAAWLGIQGVSDSSDVAKGVRVLSVAKGSPASLAKLRPGDKGEGDLIVGVDGKPVTTPEDLAAAVRSHAVGEKVPLTLLSGGKYRVVDVVLSAPPEIAKTVAPKPKAKARLAGEETSTEPSESGELTPNDVVGLTKKALSGGRTMTIKTGKKGDKKAPKKGEELQVAQDEPLQVASDADTSDGESAEPPKKKKTKKKKTKKKAPAPSTDGFSEPD
jgi:serine protease Do